MSQRPQVEAEPVSDAPAPPAFAHEEQLQRVPGRLRVARPLLVVNGFNLLPLASSRGSPPRAIR